MIRVILHVLALFILFTLQVSFIHALPFPFDRIPLVLVVTIYAYQYQNRKASWWWFIFYGFILDLLAISYAPFEMVSYALVSITTVLLAQRVFTNKSYYGMTATALLSLAVLSLSQLLTTALFNFAGHSQFFMRDIVYTNIWSAIFASALLLFVFPSIKKFTSILEKTILQRI